MQRPQRDPRIDRELTRAVCHPLRLLILKLAAHERDRCLSVKELTSALVVTPGWEHVNASEVNYHRNCLVDAELLPLPE